MLVPLPPPVRGTLAMNPVQELPFDEVHFTCPQYPPVVSLRPVSETGVLKTPGVEESFTNFPKPSHAKLLLELGPFQSSSVNPTGVYVMPPFVKASSVHVRLVLVTSTVPNVIVFSGNPARLM
ncbi:MAG TPA: hypothetical protein VFL28_01305 [bacterium]|nr:hypothetical protein [bacterium]